MEGRPPDLKSKTSQEDNGEQRSSLNHIHDRAQGQLVQHKVATQAAIAPKALAVAHGNEALDYGSLSARANQIARFLNSQGICAESLVAVCMERSLSMVIANLGVLTSGAAYLPLDPSYPNERLKFMLNDARPQILLTQHHLAKRLSLGDWHTIIVAPDGPEFSRQSKEWMDGGAKSHNLAYVIYTSGSTGLPKGVQITHANLSNLVNWHQEAFNIRPADRALHFSSPSFDAAVWELWPYLATGASVHLAEDDFRNSPSALRDWITKEKLTIGFVPTPIAEHMISLEWSPKTSLRLLLTGADTLRKYPRQGLPFTLINNYGPTECTVVASSGAVPPSHNTSSSAASGAPELPNIGRPISNTQIFILNHALEKVPEGEVGEMHIGGANVARGYLNRPELTDEKFVVNPFANDSKTRLYRSGDLGRYLADGQIAFQGRVDDQIKIRGYRIEPNEVVSALCEHEAVLHCAVMARVDGGGNKYLVAYLVFGPGSQPTGTELHDFLSHRLPVQMVPSVFVALDALPLKPSGKVDKASLPAPDSTNTITDAARTAPRTVVERGVAKILLKLLDVKEIGVSDNFFLLGGHSLLAAQLISSIRERFGVEFPLRMIFDSPTVAQLSEQIEKLTAEKINAMTPEQIQRALAAGQS